MGSTSTPLAHMLWDGSPPQGRRMLLHAEQGLGDAIQFIRYAALLKERGAGRIALVVPKEMHRLLRRCPGLDDVVAEALSTDFDVSIGLLSLPRLLGTTDVVHIPRNVPYLDSDPALVERWQSRLSEMGAPRTLRRVGIVWQGNPRNRRDRWRSVRLEQFAPLADLENVKLISLQKGAGSEQLAQRPQLALDLDPHLSDLEDTAAVIRCLDLVITVDTAVAHLAGALAAPVWLAMPTVPDWRWLLGRTESPWYPTMRLFRQALPGRWDDVFQQMKEALAVWNVGE